MFRNDINGILIVDKPKGMTSYDVVDFLKKNFKIKKVGHAGTLDPMATGLLVLLLGKATKESARFSNSDKEYQGIMTLGLRTDTGDIDGEIVSKNEIPSDLIKDDLKKAFNRFIGTIEQIPPMFSAIKYKGRPLYKFARRGLAVKRSPRKISIKSLKLVNFSLPYIEFRVLCSKGTYIRSLCQDIGDLLRCGACLSQLRRTKSGDFSIDEAISFDQLKNLSIDELRRLLH